MTRLLKPEARGVDTFTFVVEAAKYRLLGIEIDLEDGSSIKTDFSQVKINAPMPPALFEPDLTGYKQAKF